jgi:hypothetical protein
VNDLTVCSSCLRVLYSCKGKGLSWRTNCIRKALRGLLQSSTKMSLPPCVNDLCMCSCIGYSSNRGVARAALE